MARKTAQLSNSEISNLKIGALVGAIYHSKKPKSLSSFVRYIDAPCESSSGDFFWGRSIDGGAIIVVGDATGHDAYAALLRTIIGLSLQHLSRNGNLGTAAEKGRISPRHVLTALGTLFGKVMKRATDRLQRDGDYRRIGERMKGDGFDAAACVITPDKVRVCTAGMPVYVVSDTGIRIIGAFDELKKINCDPESVRHLPKATLIDRNARFLVFVSDGIVHQKNAKRREFGEAGLKELLARTYESDPLGCRAETLKTAVFDACEGHRSGAGVDDDRLVVVVDLRRRRAAKPE